MAARGRYEELARQISAVGVVKRGVARVLPAECPGGAAAVLALLDRHGGMRLGRLAGVLGVDASVTSRHVALVVEHGWVERSPDPDDRRSRILCLTPAGRDVLDDLGRRTADLFADRLRDWDDEEVGQLVTLLARLRSSFGDGRAHPVGAPPTAGPEAEPPGTEGPRTGHPETEDPKTGHPETEDPKTGHPKTEQTTTHA